MSVIVEKKNGRFLFVKGASEMVLSCCNMWMDPSTNRMEVLSSTVKEHIESAIHKMA